MTSTTVENVVSRTTGIKKKFALPVDSTLSQAANAAAVGSFANVDGLVGDCTRFGNYATLNFTLTNVVMNCTDAGASGSSGSVQLFTFVQQAIASIGCRQNYSSIVEGGALTSSAGDAVYQVGLGSVAVTAKDGSLGGTDQDLGGKTSTITDSGGVGSGSKVSAPASVLDGTDTPVGIFLNWSGTAATIDANGTMTFTGTITLLVALLGDD